MPPKAKQVTEPEPEKEPLILTGDEDDDDLEERDDGKVSEAQAQEMMKRADPESEPKPEVEDGPKEEPDDETEPEWPKVDDEFHFYLRTPQDFMKGLDEFGAISRGELTFFKEVNEEILFYARNSQGQRLFKVSMREMT